MESKAYELMNWRKIEDIVYAECDNPHDYLGSRRVEGYVLFQCFFPDAAGVVVRLLGSMSDIEMERMDDAGYFAVAIEEKYMDKYQYVVYNQDGSCYTSGDPYRHEPQISREDTEKFKHGIHYTVYEKLGAHPCEVDGERGTLFAVWAPNALRVSVVGDFNCWDGRRHQMRRLWDSGIFEIFIPDVGEGMNYKFEIKLKTGLTYLKADPYGNAAQMRPDTASVVADLSKFTWEDEAFISKREEMQSANSPISIYEMYMGSFVDPSEGEVYANYREIAPKVIDYVKKMGYTHVELMPIMEHPFDGSWGYQVIGYYAPTARYGSPADFMYFVNELHKAGIGVILDWVPAHFPRDTYGLSNFDGTCLYEHLDPRQGAHPHWGTLIYNYGRPQVSNYLIANALFWIEKYHVDGIRMDAVASMLYLDYGKDDGEWVANMYGGKENLEAIEFIKHLNSIMKKRNLGVLSIAEESTAFPMITGKLEDGGLGFDLKWNMGFMNDYLGYIKNDPYFRSYHHNEITFSMIYAYSENFAIVFSHDEVVHGKATMAGKMPGTKEEKLANLRLSYGYMMTHPGKKCLFMGQDIAEFDEWNENRRVQWNLLEQPEHAGVAKLYADLNHLYTSEKSLYINDTSWDGFEWMNAMASDQCYLTYVRKGETEDDMLLVIANFSGAAQDIRTGIVKEGKYVEVINTDDVKYGGQGNVNAPVMTEDISWDGREQSVVVKMAPLSMSILRYVPYTPEEQAAVDAQRQKKIDEEKKRLEEEEKARKAEEARILKEEEKARKAEEKRLAAEEAKRIKAEEKAKKAEEAKRLKEEEKVRKAEEAKRLKEEEKARKAEEKRLAAEEAKRIKAEEKAKLAEEKRLAAEEAKKLKTAEKKTAEKKVTEKTVTKKTEVKSAARKSASAGKTTAAKKQQ